VGAGGAVFPQLTATVKNDPTREPDADEIRPLEEMAG
jgi:hypothetical protein